MISQVTIESYGSTPQDAKLHIDVALSHLMTAMYLEGVSSDGGYEVEDEHYGRVKSGSFKGYYEGRVVVRLLVDREHIDGKGGLRDFKPLEVVTLAVRDDRPEGRHNFQDWLKGVRTMTGLPSVARAVATDMFVVTRRAFPIVRDHSWDAGPQESEVTSAIDEEWDKDSPPNYYLTPRLPYGLAPEDRKPAPELLVKE